jgi:hypothetical protein
MDREQAAKIHEHLLDAAGAIRRANDVLFDFDKETRKKFAEYIGYIDSDIHFEMLPIIYDQFPDLKPVHEEIPEICSTLQWEDVRLPPSVTEADIDGVIFSVLKPQWRKTAAIVGWAHEKCEELGWPIGDEVLVARLEVLAEAGWIDHQGYLRYWRHSEVRLQP